MSDTGYITDRNVWTYTADLSRQWGEAPARKSQIWVQGGTPDMGEGFLDVWEATGDPYFLECAKKAANALVYGQHPLGGWPQRYPLRYEFVHDGLPDYTSLYTYNDGVITNNIDLLVRAYEQLGDERCMEAARRGMDFIILSQGPEGQAAWADQHGMDLKPAWGRTHEHAGYMPRYTIANIRALQNYYLVTGDRRYLQPIPPALDWLEKSALSKDQNGRSVLANRYEYGTNRPIEIVRTNRVNEEGYGIWEWKYVPSGEKTTTPTLVDITAMRREYEKIAALSPADARARHAAAVAPRQYRPRKAAPAEIRKLLDGLDKRGARVEDVVVYSMDITKPSPKGVKWDNYNQNVNDDHATTHIQGISTSAFRKHMRVLADYAAGLK